MPTLSTPSLDSHRAAPSYSIRDSFNLTVLGDLHLEDYMQWHNEAREDCLFALEDLSLLPSVVGTEVGVGAGAAPLTPPSFSIKDILPSIQSTPAGDLTVSQLEF